jgi:hypothetical protein
MNYQRIETISLKRSRDLSEQWLQDTIARDPTILGLGEVFLRERERVQVGAGRLDLLLQDVDDERRYEVEIQLGQTDESHIIRTIEYWDIERRRHPNYEHIAVIVAEEITGRFLNVISLFNRSIPLIALQVKAVNLGEDRVGLFFTRVLDTVTSFADDEDDEPKEDADRGYWEARASKESLAALDAMLKVVQQFDASLQLNYRKPYIGLARNGKPDNFIIFKPQKGALRIEPRVARTPERDAAIEASGLDVLEYRVRWSRYLVKVAAADLKREQTRAALEHLMREAFDQGEK